MNAQQPNKSAKKASKRRNRSKRRRKLRQQRKFQVIETEAPKKTSKLPPEERSRRWEALCLETFQKLTNWQCEAELNFWKARTEYLQKENNKLKFELESMRKEAEKNQIHEQSDVDADYLEFIAITQKHREELKRARANKIESTAAPD